jgi:hypothetical protein
MVLVVVLHYFRFRVFKCSRAVRIDFQAYLENMEVQTIADSTRDHVPDCIGTSEGEYFSDHYWKHRIDQPT